MQHGELDRIDDRWRLRFRRRLRHSPEKVWRAITEPGHLVTWYPTTIDGERRAGAPLRFAFVGQPGPASHGRMTVYDPPTVMEFVVEGETFRFELEPVDDGCVLTFSTVFDAIGKTARDAAGWHVCLDLLEGHLDGVQPPSDTGALWGPLNAEYARRFGPESATIGPPEWYDPSR